MHCQAARARRAARTRSARTLPVQSLLGRDRPSDRDRPNMSNVGSPPPPAAERSQPWGQTVATIVISVVLVLSWVAMYAIYQNKKRREAKEAGKVTPTRKERKMQKKESKEKLKQMSPREKWLNKKAGGVDDLAHLSPREKWLAAKTGQVPGEKLRAVVAMQKAGQLKNVIAMAKAAKAAEAAKAAQAGGGEAKPEDLNVIVEADESEAVPLMPVQHPSMQLVEESSEEAMESPKHVPSKRSGQATLEARLSQQSLLSVSSTDNSADLHYRRPSHVPSSVPPDQATIEERLSRARSSARMTSPEGVRPTSAPTSPPPLDMQNGGDDQGGGGEQEEDPYESEEVIKTLSI